MILDRIIRAFLGGIVLWVMVITIHGMIVVNFPRKHSIRSESFGIAYSLKNAISAYFTEYREFPVQPDDASDEQTDSGPELMKHLVNEHSMSDSQNAPRNISFFTVKCAMPLSDGRFKRGISKSEKGEFTLWDSWGNLYLVRLDSDRNGQIEAPQYTDKQISESILVWSAGPDRDFETWDDNIKTW